MVVALALPAAASAHSFLVRSDPPAGARLASSPSTTTLFFSEPFGRASERVTIRRVAGGELVLPRPSVEGTSIRQPLPAKLRGVFVVSWRVLSDDGHTSLGEFAFAVGSNAALPAVKATNRTPWSEVAASWLVFVGIAVALGGLVSERFVWRRTPLTASEVVGAPVLAGLLVAALGAVIQLVLVAGGGRGGGFGAGLSGAALGDALGTRPGELTVALLVALCIAAALAPLRWLRLMALAPLLAAIGFTAARGHSGTSEHSWAVVTDAIHLATVALWLGALFHLVAVVAHPGERRVPLGEATRRYSRLALPTVVLIVVTGVLTAIPEFRSFGSVISSGYGRTLLIKAGLVGVAFALAFSARRWALAGSPDPHLPLLRRLTIGEAATLAGVLVVASVLVNAAPPRGASAAKLVLPQLGPPPLAGPSFQLADLAGQLVVAVAASERELRFTVVPPGDQPSGELKLTGEARRPDGRSVDLFPRPCGDACFSIRFRLTHGTTELTAKISSSEWSGGAVHFVVPWPLPPEQPRLLQRVAAAMRATRAVSLTETVTSGPGSGGHALPYRLTGKAFMKSEFFAAGGVDVRSLRRGGGLTEVAFALPGSNLWYRMWIDTRLRLRRELILSPGHRIYRTFSYAHEGR